MKIIPSELLLNIHNALGEGPVWDEKAKELYWIDGLGCRWFRMDADRNIREFTTPSAIGSLILKEEGGMLMGLQDGIYETDPETGAQTLFANPEADIEGNRFNDGKADPAGRYVIGSMSTANNDGSSDDEPAGSLYSIEADGSWQKLRGGCSISNGMAWNKALDTFFYVDSPTCCVFAYDYDKATGKISNERVAARIPEGEGIPDGMCIDAEDNLWVAQWGGWCVSCFDSKTGERIAKVEVPVKHVTCCAFGGEDLETLYITTSTNAVAGKEWLNQPLAGGLFTAKPGVKGTCSFRFGKKEA